MAKGGDIAGQALKLIASAKTPAAVQAGVELLARDDPRLRDALLDRYAFLDSEPDKRDPRAYVRAELLRSLGQLASGADLALLERATLTYEFGSSGESAGVLRGAGLVVMSRIDERLAGFHAARLLTDAHTSAMSGEPALTGVRVLAAQGQTHVLYGYLVNPGVRNPEAIAEALRAMSAAPTSIVRHLLELYGEDRDDLLLLGLFDLLLQRPDIELFAAFTMRFLQQSVLLDLCRYVATAIVAGRNQALIAMLAKAPGEARGENAAVLEEALALLDS